MADRGKVLKGLECCIDPLKARCPECPYYPCYDEDTTSEKLLADSLALLKEQEPQTVGGWISVEDKLPESGKHVLLTCEISKKRYVCDGFYSKAHTLPQGHYPEDDVDYDYDEDEDEYYLKEGWYEVIHNWDDYSSVVIYDSVTHWMPLPKPAQEESDNA